jgi:hypothetical protein
MDLSTPTEELTVGGASEPAGVARTELRPVTTTVIRQGCPACGAAMATDQRYCVECGERRGAPRVSLLEGPARRLDEGPQQRVPSPPRRTASVNSTFVSIIGVLLLAVGIGVLIGRSGSTTVKSPPAQVVTISGEPSTGTAATTPATGAGTTSTGESPSTGTASKSKSKAAAKSTSTKAKTPLPKAVKVGSAGHGRGYQNGHFTGNFFGQ